MDTTKATPELFDALAQAQGEIENASKSSSNPHFKSKYADLAEVLNTVRPVLSKFGLSVTQSTGYNGSLVSVTTLLAHKSGGYITSEAACQPAKSDAQGIGAATTDLRRYSLAAMTGVAQEDDDGQSAAHNRKPAPVAQLTGNPKDGAWEGMTDEERTYLLKVAGRVSELIADPMAALDYLTTLQLDSQETLALWTRLDSKTRSALKKAKDATTQKEAA